MGRGGAAAIDHGFWLLRKPAKSVCICTRVGPLGNRRREME